MIRYPIRSSVLRVAIDEVVPTWFEDAEERSTVYRAEGQFVKVPSPIWGQIKTVLMRVQGAKCGFCERRLERSRFGNIEHDVEHFRPKGKVTVWPTGSIAPGDYGIDFDVGTAADTGYFMLAHNHENYLMSCKTCNSILKANGFPVDGERDLQMENPRSSAEKPFLCFPIGRFDDDPEALIRFRGIVPIPAANRGHRRKRGKLIIAFFDLAGREGLLRERAVTIAALHVALDAASQPDTSLTGRVGRQLVESLTADDAAHANCARSFRKLSGADPTLADQYVEATLAYLISVGRDV